MPKLNSQIPYIISLLLIVETILLKMGFNQETTEEVNLP